MSGHILKEHFIPRMNCMCFSSVMYYNWTVGLLLTTWLTCIVIVLTKNTAQLRGKVINVCFVHKNSLKPANNPFLVFLSEGVNYKNNWRKIFFYHRADHSIVSGLKTVYYYDTLAVSTLSEWSVSVSFLADSKAVFSNHPLTAWLSRYGKMQLRYDIAEVYIAVLYQLQNCYAPNLWTSWYKP